MRTHQWTRQDYTRSKSCKPRRTHPLLSVVKHALMLIITVYHNHIRESESICCPVQEEVVGRLRSAFHRDALFFWDGTMGDELGVLWRPAVKAASSFVILSSRNRVVPPGGSDAITTMNRDELLLQLIDLADGLLSVHRIDDLLS